jgi:hypothetical protein
VTSRTHVAQGYQPARRLTVTVVADTTGEDLTEAVAEFTRTLADQLKSRGIDATIAAGPAAPPAAQIDVEEWNPGNQALRYFVGFGSGEGHMTVAVHVTGPDGADALQGPRTRLRAGRNVGRFIHGRPARGREVDRERDRDGQTQRLIVYIRSC